MNAYELQTQLAHFHGSQTWTRHPFNRSFLYTEGVEHVADQAGAYWLLDIIATEIAGTVINDHEYFGVVTLAVEGQKALLAVFDDLPGRKLYTRPIEYTDFPEGLWKFYLVYDGEHCVLMVPSEY